MADYTSTAMVKSYVRISGTADDSLIGHFVTRACAMIDDYTGRWFVPRGETRIYDAVGEHITSRLLILDADILSLTSIVNGDGTSISTGDVTLRPPNMPPYYGFDIKESTGIRWTYNGTPEGAIQVTGIWGYANTTPEVIKQAALQLAVWLYRQRDRRDVEGIPKNIEKMLDPYHRLRMKIIGAEYE